MSKKVKIIISMLVLIGVINVGSVSAASPVRANASTISTSTVIGKELPNSTTTATVADSTAKSSESVSDSTATYESKNNSLTTPSSATVSINSNRDIASKEVSQSSNTKSVTESTMVLYSIDGYKFHLDKDGAGISEVPRSESTVVIPNSVNYCGKVYPVIDISLSDQKGFWFMKTLVIPPGVKTMYSSYLTGLSSLKNVIYTGANNPFDTQSSDYSKLISSGVSITKGDYSSFTEDKPNFAKVDDTINLDDDFVITNVVFDNVTYSLSSGRFATALNAEPDKNGDVRVADNIEFNGVKFKVISIYFAFLVDNNNVKNVYLPNSFIKLQNSIFCRLHNLKHVYYNSTSETRPSFISDGSAFMDCNISTITVVNSNDEYNAEVLPVQCDVPVTSVSSKTYDKSNLFAMFITLAITGSSMCLIVYKRRIH